MFVGDTAKIHIIHFKTKEKLCFLYIVVFPGLVMLEKYQ